MYEKRKIMDLKQLEKNYFFSFRVEMSLSSIGAFAFKTSSMLSLGMVMERT